MKIEFRKQEVGDALPVLLAIRRTRPGLSDALHTVTSQAKFGLSVEIEPLEPHHTTPQRGYYHKWKNAFANFCGNTPDEMHEHLLCETYGSKIHRTRLGLMQRPVHRSSDANRVEYTRLIETLIRVAAEFGFVVPPAQRKEYPHERSHQESEADQAKEASLPSGGDWPNQSG